MQIQEAITESLSTLYVKRARPRLKYDPEFQARKE